jgi:hypothetical protein
MKHLVTVAVVAMVLALALTSVLAQNKTAGKEIGVRGALPPVTSVPVTPPPSVIFQEGFNDAVFPPAGWNMLNVDGNTSTDPTDTAWYQSASVGGNFALPPYEGTAFAADYYGSAEGVYLDDYLITPNTGGSAPVGTVDSLVFYAVSRRSASGEYLDSLDIRVSTTGITAADFTQRLDYVLVPKPEWTRFAYELPITTNRYIAFRYLMYDGGSGTNSDKVCVDDVQIVRYTPSVVNDPKGGLPTEFALKQNYPNPFNPSTTIEFQLNTSAATTLTILNVLGEAVATVVDGDLAPGRYTVNVNGSNLASGVYFYRLVSGSFVGTKRMLLVK